MSIPTALRSIAGKLNVVEMPAKKIGVYFLVADEEIAYVGQSTNIDFRIYTHVFEKGAIARRIDMSAITQVLWMPVAEDLLHEVESALIRTLQPKGNGRRENGLMFSRNHPTGKPDAEVLAEIGFSEAA